MSEQYSAELCHHGILGQKWGVRRFQNSDGSLTSEGLKRYKTKGGLPYITGTKIVKDLNEARRESKKSHRQDIKDLRAKKRNNELTKEQYKEDKKKAGQKLDKYLKSEEEASYKAYAQTTKKGKNIALGILETTAGTGLTFASQKAIDQGKNAIGFLSGAAGGALMGMGIATFTNEAGASKYRK